MSFTVTNPINTYNCNDKIKKKTTNFASKFIIPPLATLKHVNIYYCILYVVEEEYFLMHAFISDKVSTCFLPRHVFPSLLKTYPSLQVQ